MVQQGTPINLAQAARELSPTLHLLPSAEVFYVGCGKHTGLNALHFYLRDCTCSSDFLLKSTRLVDKCAILSQDQARTVPATYSVLNTTSWMGWGWGTGEPFAGMQVRLWTGSCRFWFFVCKQILKTKKRWCLITTFHTIATWHIRSTMIFLSPSLTPDFAAQSVVNFWRNLDSGPPHANLGLSAVLSVLLVPTEENC